MWGHDRTRSAILLLFTPIYLFLWEPSIKTQCGDQQWKPGQPLLPRAFILHTIKCSIGGGALPIHSTLNHTQIRLLGNGGDTCARPLSSKETDRVRQRKLGRGDRSATGSPTDVWTKTLRKSACMSVTSFYSHGLFRPSCLLEESSWVGGFVWPRSLGGQAFHQLLTQGCQPIHPQNLSMRGRGVLICKCAVLLGFFSVFRELRIPLLWSGLSDKEVGQAVFGETVDLRSTERAKGMELDFFICKGAF